MSTLGDASSVYDAEGSTASAMAEDMGEEAELDSARKWWHVADQQIETLVASLACRGGASAEGVGETPLPAKCRTTSVAVPPRPTTAPSSDRTARPTTAPSSAVPANRPSIGFQAVHEVPLQLAAPSPVVAVPGAASAQPRANSAGASRAPLVPGAAGHAWERFKRASDQRRDGPNVQPRSRPLSGSCSARCAARTLSSASTSASAARSPPLSGTCSASASRRSSAVGGERAITIYVQNVHTADKFAMRVSPDMRIGPDVHSPAGGVVEVAEGDECEPTSLKAKIEEALGIDASRQRLNFRASPMASDAQTLSSYGVTDGATVHLRVNRDSPVDRRGVVLACSARKSAKEAMQEDSETLSTRSYSARSASARKSLELRCARGGATMMPKWVSQEYPKLFAPVGIALDGHGGYRPFEAFALTDIYRSQEDDQASSVYAPRSRGCAPAAGAAREKP
eukprot:CAMPEP_0117621776 /NCGR_PEP_ID=MMETSP0784-20121206/87806_1 /TAXON_ID=39447 /ORGANISM="" /LENGTH=453 /DNA_ID=CAMNT_0005425707 /DNA_START=8 /DNA_END=1366 /DNA_ORIENTATION=-